MSPLHEDAARAAAAHVFTPEAVDLWMTAPNQLLDGKSPQQYCDDNDIGPVLDLLHALADGVFL